MKDFKQFVIGELKCKLCGTIYVFKSAQHKLNTILKVIVLWMMIVVHASVSNRPETNDMCVIILNRWMLETELIFIDKCY